MGIYFVVALLPEARPLIDFFNLKLLQANPFKIYRDTDKFLIISGVGKARSAKAVEFLHTFFGGERNQIWINIGIAGHAERHLAEGVLAHKITDEVTRKSWYPPIVINPPCPTGSLLTVEQPCTQYDGSFFYEMEASGFYDMATRFSTAELVQCFKVISDNRQSSRKVTARLVERLIGGNLKIIEELVQKMIAFKEKLPKVQVSPHEFQKFLGRWHFTVSEQHRLRRFLKRLGTLQPKEEIFSEIGFLHKSKDVLHFLEDKINSLPIELQ